MSKRETDKYFVVVKKKDFRSWKEDRFSLLEDVKSVSVGNKIPATLSMGWDSLATLIHRVITMPVWLSSKALARGGDQAVIKDCNGITYYGGKRK